MTTVTTTTVESPSSAANRVMSIRKKFETLCHLEHLDISAPETKRAPKYLFQRSATTFNLSALRSRPKNHHHQHGDDNDNKENGRRSVNGTDNDNDGKCNEALALLRKSLRRDNNKSLVAAAATKTKVTSSPPSSPIAQPTTPTTKLLVRQSSDPRRASIKRSPAFRVGETHQKIELVAKSHSFNAAPSDPQQQLTDTLRKALKQPLPPGPPPKKPPRLLSSPTTPNKPSPFPIQEEEQQQRLMVNNAAVSRLNAKKTNATTTAITNKKPVNGCWSKKLANGIKSNVNQIAEIARPGGNLLCCNNNNNSANVYDDVAGSCYEAPQQQQQQRRRLGEGEKNENGTNSGAQKVALGGRKSEPIYMEPFQHLTMNLNNGSVACTAAAAMGKPEVQQQRRRFSADNSLVVGGSSRKRLGSLSSAGTVVVEREDDDDGDEDGGSNEEQQQLNLAAEDTKSVTGSIQTTCSCPEEHSAAVEKLQDLHYLCTNLSDQHLTGHKHHHQQQHHQNHIDSHMHDSDPPLSLSKTYDEINLLLNAAFNKRLKSPASSLDEDGEIVTIMGNNNSVSAANNSSSSSITLPGGKQAAKLTRSLTEKRKDYVRRISIKAPEAIPAIVASNYGALNQTFKSPVKTFTTEAQPPPPPVPSSPDSAMESTGDRIKRFQKLIQENNNSSSAPEKDLPSSKLFKSCLLVGFNLSTNLPYQKFVYPPTKGDDPSAAAPENIERLIFPTRHLLNQKRANQEYSLIITDDNGQQLYGYCRRVLPENCEYCLPLAYCIVSAEKAPGFYFRVLKEIEMRHGQTESQAMVLLKHLHNCHLPEPGKVLHVKVNLNTVTRRLGMLAASSQQHKVSPKRMSLEVNPKWLTEASLATLERREGEEKKRIGSPVDEKTLSFITRGNIVKGGSPGEPRMEEILIRRPTDLRLESTEISTLYESLGSDLLLHAFSSLLLERKVILFGSNISVVTSCVLGLQTILYPFKWQHTLITILPEELLEICQAPFPVLAGTLTGIEHDLEDGLVIDVDRRLLVQQCGDECTILPPSLRASLLMSLEMVNLIDQGKMLSNVLIAEAFLRFFVELFANYKQKSFEKDAFIQSHPVASVNLFLEWFVETSLFRHFLNNKPQFGGGNVAQERVVLDEQLGQSYYTLFDAKLLEKAENKSKTDQSIENIMKNCKLINKKAKTFKERFKHFFD